MEAVKLMHKVLDEEADEKEKHKLKIHLHKCQDCRQHFEQLKKTETIVQGASYGSAPGELKGNILNHLPRKNRFSSAKRWPQRHPILTAVVLFFILISGYLFALWETPQGVSVDGDGHLKQIDGVVVVPENEVIHGDLTVRNSDIEIKGKVNGDVTVINGQQHMAATGQVNGRVKEVDQMMEWVWYQMKHLVTGFSRLSGHLIQ